MKSPSDAPAGPTPAEYEYVVVGSGAGGGTVAARLAEYGHRVLLLEAGGDPRKLSGGDPVQPDANRLPADYEVPAFNAAASENDAIKWDFFVRHYHDDALQRRDPKYVEEYQGRRVDGVLYPRSGCLGGCTAHNAMITVYPHNDDWRSIAELTGDPSWSPSPMRSYFQRLENCHHRPGWRLLAKLTGINPTRHGFGGWLHTEVAIPDAVLRDRALVRFIIDTAAAEAEDIGTPLAERIRWDLLGEGDPNDWRLVEGDSTGLRYTPLATRDHARNGTRERVLDVAARYPDRLTVELDALATRVLLDDGNRAVGVEYLKGARLYRAFLPTGTGPGETRTALASREVILAGGAYNTPQLLMLSGVGPRAELERHGIPVRVDLPGVGSNLQDRYEIAVVNRMSFDHWYVLAGSTLSPGDPQYEMWKNGRRGVYTTNGAVAAVVKRSFPQRPLPDLFMFAIVSDFRGYFPGYSALSARHLNYLTWSILKAHTANHAGTVRLRSADPRDMPHVDFRYFGEGNDPHEEDLKSVVAGIRFVRRLTARMRATGLIAEEELPGEALQTDEQLGGFVRDNAWGHHASCSCPIGAREQGGVVNGDFQVHGTRGLRIVDASVFPKIPGFFIATSVYMIGEKAADVISAASRA
ncbi:MAG TPA: GMC family oxidoreductase [Longimicrobium sp.]|nr:GMC family oxidoreductase [Longimicrobium sp.]